MPVELGSGFKAPPSMYSDILGELFAQLDKRLNEQDDKIRQALALRQNVVVQPSPVPVSVAAPNVEVTPTFKVDVPESEAVDLSTLEAEITGLRADVKALTAALMQPVVREVQRDADKLINRVIERRA